MLVQQRAGPRTAPAHVPSTALSNPARNCTRVLSYRKSSSQVCAPLDSPFTLCLSLLVAVEALRVAGPRCAALRSLGASLTNGARPAFACLCIWARRVLRVRSGPWRSMASVGASSDGTGCRGYGGARCGFGGDSGRQRGGRVSEECHVSVAERRDLLGPT